MCTAQLRLEYIVPRDTTDAAPLLQPRPQGGHACAWAAMAPSRASLAVLCSPWQKRSRSRLSLSWLRILSRATPLAGGRASPTLASCQAGYARSTPRAFSSGVSASTCRRVVRKKVSSTLYLSVGYLRGSHRGTVWRASRVTCVPTTYYSTAGDVARHSAAAAGRGQVRPACKGQCMHLHMHMHNMLCTCMHMCMCMYPSIPLASCPARKVRWQLPTPNLSPSPSPSPSSSPVPLS